MAPPADMVMLGAPEAAPAYGAAPSPFAGFAFCGVPPPCGAVLAPPACCGGGAAVAAACLGGCPDDGADACPGRPASVGGSVGACSMDHDGPSDQEERALDDLLAAAACKPACGAGAASAATAATSPVLLQLPRCHALLTTPPLPPAARSVLAQYGASRAAAGDAVGVLTAASALIAGWGLADTFYVYDLGEVVRLHGLWTAALPRVAPYYAVKCNPEPGIVAMLDALGAGFDCASVQELERAAALGVPQSRVIFANPCKRPSDFRYARERGVEYTTFDCASELEKIAAGARAGGGHGYPAFKCVLRIRCDDETCKINLGLKYGADPGGDVPHLLALAKDLGLKVVGVSFHVGSGCQNVAVYAEAIRRARAAFDAAAALGFDDMHLLDVGGGFTAPYDEASADLFYRTAAVINGALDEHFPAGCGVRVIAEPGRYFAETSATLFTTVLGQRAAPAAAARGAGAGLQCGAGAVDYRLSDNTYGSFRIQVAVDGLEPLGYSALRSPLLPPAPPELCEVTPARLWGDSGADADCVHPNAVLPRLRDGDWVAFPCAGAYTICSASRFGGGRMDEPTKMFVCSDAAERDLGPLYATAAARATAALGGAAAVLGGAAGHVPVVAATAAADAVAAAAAAEMLQALSVGRACLGDACCGDDAMSVASGASDGSDGTTSAAPEGLRHSNSGSGGAGDAPMAPCDGAAPPVRHEAPGAEA